MIRAIDVIKRIDCRDEAIRKAEEVVNSNFIQKIAIFQSSATSVSVKTLCFRASDPRETVEVTVKLRKETNNNVCKIQNVHCTCFGGKDGVCKHSTATLLELTR